MKTNKTSAKLKRWYFLASSLIAVGFILFAPRPAVAGPETSDEAETSDGDEELKATVPSGPVITLTQYLNEVRDKHGDYRAAKKSYEAAQLSAFNSQVVLSPYLFGSASYQNDKKPNLLFNYAQVENSQIQLGIAQTTSIGLSGRAYYTLTNSAYTGIQLGGPPINAAGYQGAATLELTFSLWRNFGGGETQLQLDIGKANSAADEFNQSFQVKSLLVGAETTYWNLFLARETVTVSRAAVERANQLYKWHARRAGLGLSNKADLLQAEAALQSRTLELRSAEDAEVAASRLFNATRGVNSSAVNEQILSLTPEQLSQIAIPARKEVRDDVKAAAEMVKVTKANSELVSEQAKPTVEVFGNASTNSPNPQDNTNIFGNSLSTSRPTTMVGLRLNTPLNLGLIAEGRRELAAREEAAQISYTRKLLDQETNWSKLEDRFNQDKIRVVLYDKLEKTQKIKLDYERQRRTQGLTTTQQVIIFEQDYQQAQLGRIQTESDLLQVLAQMKLYGDTYGLR